MAAISKELRMLDDAIMEIHERIQSGRCLTNKEQTQRMVGFLQMIANKDDAISFTEACRYVGLSSATFRRYVADGKLPKGKKRLGWTEKAWYRNELDEYINNLV